MNKAYNLKVYTLEGLYKDTINNDIIMSDISFSSQINEGQGELRIQLNLAFTDSTIQKTDLIKVFEFDENNLSGVQIYTGIVGRISRISEKNGEYIELSAIGLASILSLVMYDEAGNYILTKNQETSTTIKGILDSLNAKYITFPATQLGYYKFEGNANDSSGNGYNGTVSGAVLSTDRRGFSNSAYQFNGAEGIFLPEAPYDITTNVTYCFGFKLDTFMSGMRILSKYSGGNNGHMEIFTTTPSGTIRLQFLFRGSTTSNAFNSKTIIELGKWYDVVCTYNKATGEVKAYINGVFDASSFQQPNMALNNAPMAIGRRPYTTQVYEYLRGRVEYCVFYNRILTDEEIVALRNSAKKGSGLIGYTSDSIEATAITSNISFSYTKALEAIQTTAGVTEYTWYIDAFGLFQFHPKTGAIGQRTHQVTIGKDIESITVEEDSEKVVNKYILEYSGGSTVTNSDATSIATYGLKETKETNTSILDFTTAGTAVATFLQQNKDEKKKTRVVVNSLYNIESIRPGDLLTVKNFEYQIEALQIVRTEYNPEQITIELEEYDSFSKEIFNQ